MRSWKFRTKERYHGSSISETSKRDRWSSALNGLSGCAKSGICGPPSPPPGEPHLMDVCGSEGVTGFGKSATQGTQPRVYHESVLCACKNNNIRTCPVWPPFVLIPIMESIPQKIRGRICSTNV